MQRKGANKNRARQAQKLARRCFHYRDMDFVGGINRSLSTQLALALQLRPHSRAVAFRHQCNLVSTRAPGLDQTCRSVRQAGFSPEKVGALSMLLQGSA